MIPLRKRWGISNMEDKPPQVTQPFRLLTARNGFILHVTPHPRPKQITMRKSSGRQVIYAISYMYPEQVALTRSN